jgi:hypothetical protein
MYHSIHNTWLVTGSLIGVRSLQHELMQYLVIQQTLSSGCLCRRLCDGAGVSRAETLGLSGGI